VTQDDVARVIERLFNTDGRALAVVGPHDPSEFSGRL
jgi:hypothetical protein